MSAKINRLAAKFLKRLKIKGKPSLDIYLLPHAEIKALKARFFRKQTEPNVLSFPEPKSFPHPDKKGKHFLGEIYLNKDILKKSPERTAPLLLHGILHLLGYDHIKGKDAAKMEKLERKILGRS
ncbi:MAG TPA: rRNA maturation RNase YbeY [Candidatus Paceibacterota bacterium]|nr:rRNA maturation RNase YbeY [Candidatus Paceibacterota bacterium]